MDQCINKSMTSYSQYNSSLNRQIITLFERRTQHVHRVDWLCFKKNATWTMVPCLMYALYNENQ